MKDNFDIGMDDIAKMWGFKKGELSGLKIEDTVVLGSESLTKPPLGCDPTESSKKYKLIYDNNIQGKIIWIGESYGHYSFGEYANVKWHDGQESDWIHTSYLKRYTE